MAIAYLVKPTTRWDIDFRKRVLSLDRLCELIIRRSVHCDVVTSFPDVGTRKVPVSIPMLLGTWVPVTSLERTLLVWCRLIPIGVMVPLQFGTMFKLPSR